MTCSRDRYAEEITLLAVFGESRENHAGRGRGEVKKGINNGDLQD